MLFRKLKKIIGWIPVIWKTYDDYTGLLDVMEHQLKRMEHDFRFHGHCVGSDRSADEMRLARLLVERLRKEDYVSNAYDFVNDPKHPILGGGFVRRPLVPKQELWDYEEYMLKQDLRVLTNLLRKKLRFWWD